VRYRKFGKLDWMASQLGFGAMRLPVRNSDYSDIDEEPAMKMIRHAIDRGVNYLDTAWNYHRDSSEGFLGRVLDDGYRATVRIATKMPCWLVEKPEDLDRFFDAQIEKLQVESIDFYLLHALQRDWWEKMKGFHYLDWAEKKMADGVIGHLGFSFHDKFPLFKRIIDDYSGWTLAMVQHNYMDESREAGTKGIRYARSKGLAVIAMEPLRGGQLAKDPPTEIKGILEGSAPGRSPAQWGLRWLWDQEDISLVLSGMGSLDQVEENLKAAEECFPGCMGIDEKDALSRARTAYEDRAGVGCTDCRYCMPCPRGVAIPFVFDYFNMMKMYDDLRMAKAHYAFLDQENRADRCTQCGDCLSLCPQHLDIPGLLGEIHGILHEEKSTQ